MNIVCQKLAITVAKCTHSPYFEINLLLIYMHTHHELVYVAKQLAMNTPVIYITGTIAVCD